MIGPYLNKMYTPCSQKVMIKIDDTTKKKLKRMTVLYKAMTATHNQDAYDQWEELADELTPHVQRLIKDLVASGMIDYIIRLYD